MSMRIDFSTNAKVVKKQIDDLSHATAKLSQQAKFARALDTNKASARELTGQLSGRKAILKLESQIAAEADRRMKTVASGYKFGNREQNQYIRGLIKQNEVMRIRTKILNDNATAMVNLGKNTQWAGRQLVVGFTVPLTIAAGAAMKAFSDLEKELVRFKRVYGDVATSGAELKQMSDQVKNLAVEWTKYGVAVSDTVQMAADAAGAGFKGDQLITQINTATKLAVLGELDKQKAMTATIALQSTFKQSNQELAQSINFLNQLENSTMVTMDDMATAIPKAATVVQGLGGDIEDLGIFMAALREGGVTAAEGANALKSGLGSLLNPSKAANEQLAGIGVNMEMLWEKSEENGRGVISVVEELATALDRLGQTQKQKVIEELFGKHQFARMNALLSNINTGTQAKQAKEVAGTGQLESALIAQQELAKLGESSLTKFNASVQKLKAAIAPLGEQVMKLVTPLVEFATKLIDKFNSMPDLFKQISVGIVAALGIVAPLMLMLLGQFQNLLGNGMKLTNWMRGWGKNTKWIAIENLTLADALGGVNAQLVAENALLQTNQKAWKTRQAAAGASAAVKPTTLGGRLKRFATGGNVPGAGNGDTVPALLTPGEFVVKKSVAQKFGNTLRAMNDGRLQGFARGVVGAKSMPAKAAAAKEKVEGLTPAQAKMEKARAYATLMKFKAYENGVIARIHKNFVAKFPQFTFAGVRNWQQWDQSHIGRADKNKIYNKELDQKQKLWNYQGDLILDNHMININLPSQNDHPVTPPEVVPFREKILGKLKGNKINPNHLITDAVLNFRQRAAGADFYNQYMDDNFIFMNLIGGKKGIANTIKSAPSGKWSVNAGKEIKGIEMNTGGWVPGTGNRDTVPAVLTPGEAVIKKSAAAKFRPVLNAMNNGTLGMFGGGYTDDIKAAGQTPLSEADRKALMNPFKAAIDNIVKEMTRTLNLGADQSKQLRQQLEKDYNETPDASHVLTERDENGKKIWRNENLVAASKQENVTMGALAGKKGAQNQEVLGRSAVRLAGDNEKKLARYNKVLDDLANGQHAVDKQSRKLLREMVIETNQYEASAPGKNLPKAQRLTPSLSGVSGAAFAGGLSVMPMNYATGKEMTKAEIKALKKSSAGNIGLGSKANVDPGSANVGKTGSRFDPYALMMMMTMFGGEITGITDKLGAFGNALTMAMPALMTMQMMGFSPSLNMKGMKGGGSAGARTLGMIGKGGKIGAMAGKFGSFGLGAAAGWGAGGAILGGIAGNAISDGKGGGRDFAGSATSWGATGAGIGMMFGPIGAAVGAAVGALAGFTVGVYKSEKALNQSYEAMSNAASSWKDIGAQLEEKYQIGGNDTMEDFFSGVADQNEKQTEMYEMLRKDLAGGEGAWGKRIEELKQMAKVGTITSTTLQTELNGLTMQLRGQGTDEESIKTILQAFVAELPGAVTQGVNASSLVVKSNDQIVKDTAASVGRVSALDLQPKADKSFMDIIKSGALFGAVGLGGMIGKFKNRRAENQQELPAINESTNLLTVSISALNQALINTAEGTKEYTELTKQLDETYANADFLDLTLRGTDREADYLKAASQGARSRIESGKGQGMTVGTLDALMAQGKVNGIELNAAAENLMAAGVSLLGVSDGLQVMALNNALIARQAATAFNKEQTELKKQSEESLIELDDAKRAYDEENRTRKDEIKFSQQDKDYAKVNAQLEIDQINIETATLQKFIGKFNKAFGSSIDSFADAQFQIDKIGAAIQAIQLKKIAPLQEKADDLRRLSELDGRKIDKLQKKAEKWEDAQQKRIKKLTDAYDEQAKALERIRQQNEYIADQQRANISLAEALSKGDLAGAANAMVQSSQNQQGYAATLQDQQLADARSAALAKEEDKKNPYDAQIEKIQARIDARALKIQALEDRIYNINEKQIEPMQRKADLMNLMLSTTKLTMENQKANVEGVDAENLAREQALGNAQKALSEARNMKTVQDEINADYDARVQKIRDIYDIQTGSNEELRAQIAEMDREHDANITRSSAKIAQLTKDMIAIQAGNKAVIDDFNSPAKAGGLADIISRTLDEINGTEPAAKPKTKTKAPELTKDQYAANYKATSEGRYSGGEIPGTGGMDSVPALLTPGEVVMRKSAVDRIGAQNLLRMNMGENPYTGGYEKFAAGGKVTGKANFLGKFGESALTEMAPKIGVDPSQGESSLWDKAKGLASKLNPFKNVGKGVSAVATAFERLIGATTIQGESVYRRCAANVRKIWNSVVGQSTVPMAPTAAKKAALLKAKYGMGKGYNAPRGALYWWDSSIGGGAGHVGVSDGRGNVINNWGGNKIERRRANGLGEAASRAYMGYTTKFAKGGLVKGKGTLNTAPLRSMNSAKSLNRPYAMPQMQEVSYGGDSSIVYNDYNLSFSIPGQMDANAVADFVIQKIERSGGSKIRSRG
jgi:TP901 family phage tail tape measure protein